MKLKLLYLPRYDMDYNTGEHLPFSTYAFIPPIGMSIVTAFLKKHGIKVEQDDLLIKVYRKNIQLLLPFCDEEKRRKFLEKGQEDTLEKCAEEILKMTKVKGFDVVGFSLFEPDNPTTGIIALVIAKILKEKFEPTIVIGGRFWGYVKKVLLQSKFVDYGILHSPFNAPAELNFLKFCEMYEKNENLEKSVPGLEYLQDDKIITNPTNYKQEEIIHFTRPDFDGLPIELYKYGVKVKVDGSEYSGDVLALPYFFVKGCPFKCAFCCNSILPGPIFNSPEKIKEDLEYLKRRYKTRYFFFLNTEINSNYKYTKEITDILKNLEIKFSDCACFVPMDKKLLVSLKKAGAARLMFGLESGSERVLRFLGKNFTIQQAEKVLKEAWEVGIWPELSLICGFPYERMIDIKKTIRFLEKNRKYIKSAYINKFFLDGKIRAYPKRYGIRILEESFKPVETLKEEWRGGFDEINGLKWLERKKLTDESFNLILSSMKRFGIRRGSELQEILFLSTLPEWEKIVRGECEIKVEQTFRRNSLNVLTKRRY